MSRAQNLRLAELIGALSLATDLGSGQPMERSLRRCLIAVGLGTAVGLDQDQLQTTYYASLLQYVGCTTEAHEIAAVWSDEIAAGEWFAEIASGQPSEAIAAILRLHGAGEPALRRARMLATALARMPGQNRILEAHCDVGERLAERMGLSPDVQRALTQVYERWDGSGAPRRLKGAEVALPVRILKLAQDAEIFHRTSGVDGAIAVARRRAGAAHDPGLVEVFCREAHRLFDRLGDDLSWQAVLDAEPGLRRVLTDAELDAALRALADFTDLKSPYLAGHSSGVAALASEAARRCRLPDAEVVTVARAGMVHDLGRVGISAAVWAKRGPLSEGEWERVRLHPYYTERILARAPQLAALGALACMHHERLDGTGYHTGMKAAAQPLAARLIAAADVYQALTEPRPHRAAHNADSAANEIRAQAASGKLDREAVEAVLTAAGHRARSRRHTWPAGLSAREVEVLRLVARGHSDRQMAAALNLSPRTVHHHVQHIYDKAGVATRATATLFAMQHDLLRAGIDVPEK